MQLYSNKHVKKKTTNRGALGKEKFTCLFVPVAIQKGDHLDLLHCAVEAV